MTVQDFISRWWESAASERANKDSFLNELCDVLGVPRPNPAKGDPDQDKYVFERQAVLVGAPQHWQRETVRAGTAGRGRPGWNAGMGEAYGHGVGYAQTLGSWAAFI